MEDNYKNYVIPVIKKISKLYFVIEYIFFTSLVIFERYYRKLTDNRYCRFILTFVLFAVFVIDCITVYNVYSIGMEHVTPDNFQYISLSIHQFVNTVITKIFSTIM